MPGALFRLILDNAAASRDQLDSVEEITVELEMDMAAEARLMIPICTTDKGAWSSESAPLIMRARRVRVEIKVGSGAWTPLIDGPVVRIDTRMSPDPSQSSATLIISDDSYWLARDDAQARLDECADSAVARKLFELAPQLSTYDIEETKKPIGGGAAVVVQHGTAMHLLHCLAGRNGMHAYVRAGATSGASVGVFRALPTRGDGIPDLVLLGPDRNLMSWSGSDDNERPATVVAHSLDLYSKDLTSAKVGLDDLSLLGSDKTLVNGSQAGTRLLSPCHVASDPQQRATAKALGLSFAVGASGEVRNDCYAGVLMPYRVVTVRGVDGRQSGTYIVKHVTHSLGRSAYTQQFKLIRNARSAGANADSTTAPSQVF